MRRQHQTHLPNGIYFARCGKAPNTTVKKMPNTGGSPYLAAGAMLLLGAAVVMGRGVVRW